jgi:hypothetical protein
VGWSSEEVLRQSRSRKDVKNKILQTFNISSGDASRPVSTRRDSRGGCILKGGNAMKRVDTHLKRTEHDEKE